MFILNNPYVSDLLKNTIIKNNYPVVENPISLDMDIKNNLISNIQAAEFAKNSEHFKLYTNSEDSIEWIFKNLSFTDIPEKINLFKDKIKFRDLLKNMYPDFYYCETTPEELKKMDLNSLKYPFILKPSVGFLSFGVYPVKTKEEFTQVLSKIDKDIAGFKGIFPKEVVNTSKFIIEEMISGEEYAIDAYFNNEGEPVILNIFHHPFLDENDVSDRIYYTSKKIITENIEAFTNLLTGIGQAAKLKNFPLHLELRTDGKNVIPIEINPMRFAGWCVTDLAYFAYGVNIYEYYMQNKKPDWNEILKNKHDELYYFICAATPDFIDKTKIKSINYEDFLSNLSEPLEVRKIDFKKKPLFSVVFGKTKQFDEIRKVLELDLSQYFEM